MKLDVVRVTELEDLHNQRFVQFAALRPLMRWAVLEAVEGRWPMD